MKLSVLRDANNQIRYSDFRSALVLTEGRLVSNRAAGEAISKGMNGTNFEHPLWTPFWTRTLVAYPSANEPFPDMVESPCGSVPRLSMDTSIFKGLENSALVIEDFHLAAQGDLVLVVPGKTVLVKNFPQEGDDHGCFAADPETGIPVSCGQGSLALWRNREASIVPVVRATHNSVVPALWLRHGLSCEFGMVVEE